MTVMGTSWVGAVLHSPKFKFSYVYYIVDIILVLDLTKKLKCGKIHHACCDSRSRGIWARQTAATDRLNSKNFVQ